jgi:hypothetical protein
MRQTQSQIECPMRKLRIESVQNERYDLYIHVERHLSRRFRYRTTI